MSNQDSNTTTGGRVILAIAGGILLFTVLALVGYLYFTPKQQPCANGDLAKNPGSEKGVPVSREETMLTIDEAASFICHSVAYPRDPSLTLQKITAFRSSSLADVVEANAYAEVRLTYLHQPSAKTLQVNVSPYDLGSPKGTAVAETIRVAGQEALETHGGPSPDYVQVDWVSKGLAFHAQTQLDGAMTQATLVSLLESIR